MNTYINDKLPMCFKLLEYHEHIHQYQASRAPGSPTIVAVVQSLPVCHALWSSVPQLVTATERTVEKANGYNKQIKHGKET